MTVHRNRRARLADWALLVGSAFGLSFGVVLLVLNRMIGNILDQLLHEKGLPSSLVLAVLLLAVWVACGVGYVFRAPASRSDAGV